MIKTDMHLRTLAGISSFSISLLCSAAMEIWPEHKLVARVIFSFSATTFLMIMLWYIFNNWLVKRGFNYNKWVILPFGLIPLNQAAQIAFDELRDTDFGKISEGLNKNNPVGYYNLALGIMDSVSLYGIHPPGTKLVPILSSELKSGFFAKDGSANYCRHNVNMPLFTNMMIKRSNLRSFIREKRKQSFE